MAHTTTNELPRSVLETLNADEVGAEDFDAIDRIHTGRDWLLEEQPEVVNGLFDRLTEHWKRYRVNIKFTDRVMGGMPSNKNIVQDWQATKIGVKSDELVRAHVTKYIEQNGGLTDGESHVDLGVINTAVETYTDLNNLNVFPKDSTGIYLQNRHFKANIKEATNILYAGQRFGATRKGPRSFVAERMFVEEHALYLQRRDESGVLRPLTQADGIFVFTGHVSGPQGDRSVLTRYQYCIQPELEVTLRIAVDPKTGNLYDDLDLSRVVDILEHGEMLGLGALRSQSMGMYKVTNVSPIIRRKPAKRSDIVKSIEAAPIYED